MHIIALSKNGKEFQEYFATFANTAQAYEHAKTWDPADRLCIGYDPARGECGQYVVVGNYFEEEPDAVKFAIAYCTAARAKRDASLAAHAHVMEGGVGSGVKGHHTDRDEPVKRPAKAQGEATSAQRVGKGKDARVLLANGKEAPEHITPAMIPPAWKNVQVYSDPNSEIYVKAEDAKGNSKTVYKPSYEAEMQAAKYVRIHEMAKERDEIDGKIRADRASDGKTKDAADAAFLIRQQATRPGSETDTKGLAQYYGKPMSAENVVVTPAKGTGSARVALKFGDKTIPVKDQGTADEIQKRLKNGGDLQDSTFWLKSHGATTLEGRHVVQQEDGVHLQFVGKEGVWHDHKVDDPELAQMLLQRKADADSRGGKLFNVTDGQLSDYVKSLDHGRFSPKDFRTQRANEIAADEISKLPTTPAKDKAEHDNRVRQVAEKVSGKLGNRWQQCVESYIDPAAWSHPAFNVRSAA